MKITDVQKVIDYSGKEALDKALLEVTKLSNEHPETNCKDISKVEIGITISYEGTSTKITSNCSVDENQDNTQRVEKLQKLPIIMYINMAKLDVSIKTHGQCDKKRTK